MTSWAGGYVSDIEYPGAFYPQQSLPSMALACLLACVDGRLPGGTDTAHYLELGCGNGLNAVLTAASNPGWQVTAVDYNPAHVAHGRALARDAGVGNVRFLEADLATLANGPHGIAPADVVTLHGVWSWVAPAVRAGIVRLLAAVVAPGGLAHVSYNALPGWQGALALQRVVREAGLRAGGRSSAQAAAGLEFARALQGAGASHLSSAMAGHVLRNTADQPPAYLAHEYMNAHWSPCFHADVAQALGEAKLDWVAPSSLLELIPQLMLTEAQLALLNQYDDPLMRELVKDTCLPRPFRHDVFVRGARRISADARDAALSGMVLMLNVPAEQFKYAVTSEIGEAELGPEYRDVVARLAAGPAPVGELAALTPAPKPAELCGILVGSGQAVPVLRPGAGQSPAAERLNRLLGGRVRTVAHADRNGGLASVSLGTALVASHITRFIYARLAEGEDERRLDDWFRRLTNEVAGLDGGKLRALLAESVPQQRVMLRHAGILA